MAPLPASAQQALALGSWSVFPRDSSGFFPVDGFFLSAVGSTQFRVVDGYITGDAFDVFINGSLAFSTNSVAAGIPSGAGDGDAAWADTRLSRGAFLLGPGDYTITLALREAAPGYDYGTGFIRADATTTVTPEPVSMALLGTGLAGVARRGTAPPGRAGLASPAMLKSRGPGA